MAQIIRKASSSGIVVWASILTIASCCLIAFGSPIFRVLGFEYSAISALLLSILVGFYTAVGISKQALSRFQLAFDALKLWAIPLFLSAVSLLFVPNCAFGEGLEFYTLIALPTTIFALAFGAGFGLLTRSTRSAIWLFGAFWLASFLVSLLPGYLYPQLFTYGWQYGFFPGLIWDEYIRLNSAYGWHLVEWAVLAILILMLAWPGERRAQRWGKIFAVAAIYFALIFLRSENGVVSSHAKVERSLNSRLITASAVVHYYAPSLSSEELSMLRQDISWYIHDIRSKLALKDTHRVSIYLYPDTESLYRLVGTRNASIAKPWLSELHIAKENLHSLRHELVHVLVREWGSYPFYASLSTAMTEGIAMALEPNYDGVHTLHEHASAILRMRLASGVSDIMGFAGFAANASTTSYVLAGSFTRYLLDHYPVASLADAYAWPDIEQAYQKPLKELEREWVAAISPLSSSMDRGDSLRTEFYFKRSSIIQQPCLRRIGKLNHLASRAMVEHRYEEAASRYRESFAEYNSISALRGLAAAQIRGAQFSAAKQTLKHAMLSDHPQRLSAFVSKGDLLTPAYFDTLVVAALSRSSMLTAYARREIALAGQSEQFLRESYSSSSPLRLLVSLDSTTFDSTSAGYRFARALINAEIYQSEGLLGKALEEYRSAFRSAQLMANSQDLRIMIQLEMLALGHQSSGLEEQIFSPAWMNEIIDRKAREKFEAQRTVN
ncbi:MAG TPA: hypothetical protein VFH43_00515 [Candidatus Kapabacteria bacterium]|nr:hypothetical protein [Candidatus Kapabacteria bacterium]